MLKSPPGAHKAPRILAQTFRELDKEKQIMRRYAGMSERRHEKTSGPTLEGYEDWVFREREQGKERSALRLQARHKARFPAAERSRGGGVWDRRLCCGFAATPPRCRSWSNPVTEGKFLRALKFSLFCRERINSASPIWGMRRRNLRSKVSGCALAVRREERELQRLPGAPYGASWKWCPKK
jgi:hypothetical protein